MDKNKLIRLVFMSISMLVYLYFFKPKPISPSKSLPLSETTDALPRPYLPATTVAESIEKTITVENDLLKVVLSTKGGNLKKVVLKQYQHNGDELVLLDEQSSQMGLALSYDALLIQTKDLDFETQAEPMYTLKVGEEAKIIFRLTLAPSQYLEHIFTFSGNSYQIGYTWQAEGMEPYLSKASQAAFCWDMDMKCLENDCKADAAKSTVNYYLLKETFKNLKISSTKVEQQVDEPLKWVTIKQRFFSSAIVAQDAFVMGNMHVEPVLNSTDITKKIRLSLQLSEQDKTKRQGHYTFFFGPNDYPVLKKVTKGFDQNLPLGWTVVRWVNQGLIIPLFSFLEQHFTNYGLIIFLLVIAIKLLLAPLSYKSFISMAKMKVVKPELDKIKAKYSHNLQKAQVEQVTFYKELGINPLSGCFPLLLQAPILLAMFNFFPNAIALRQASFLWAHDLSTYDSIIRLPFTIPVYGNHVSIFTLLMMLSTMLYAWSSNQNSVTEGPMKGLSYIMPFTFMFMLNSFPAGLSFYYCVSNVMTYLQQTLTKYFVDENVIKEKLLSRHHKMQQGNTSSFQSRVAATIQANNKKKK